MVVVSTCTKGFGKDMAGIIKVFGGDAEEVEVVVVVLVGAGPEGADCGVESAMK